MRLFLLIPLAMLIGELLWWRSMDRLLRTVRFAQVWRAILGAFVACQLAVLVWILIARRLTPLPESATPAMLVAAAYLWHLLVLPCILVCWFIAWVVGGLTRAFRTKSFGSSNQDESAAGSPVTESGISRRQALGLAAALVPPVVTGVGVAVSRTELERFRVNPLEVPIAGLPADLDGLHVAHVTDIHVGRFSSERLLRRIVEQTNKLNADVVLLTGDLINSSLRDLPDGIATVRDMQSRLGSYMCLGNHDLMDDGYQFAKEVRAAGIPLLVNQTRRLTVRGRPIELLGLPWCSSDSLSQGLISGLTAEHDPDAFQILLAHHPHAFDAAAAAGIPLTLAGHTHGGQLMLNDHQGIGPIMFRYWSGVYAKPTGPKLVVSNGVGNWFPLRVRAPAEILSIRLRRLV